MTHARQALTRLDHVALLVADVEEAVETYARLLGIDEERVLVLRDISDGEDVIHAAYIELDNCTIEFVAPAREDGVLAKQLASRGQGLHHLDMSAAEHPVTDAHQRLKDQGWRLIEDDLRTDDFGIQYTYVHPKETCGALVGLSDPTDVGEFRDAAAGSDDDTGAN